MFREDCGVPIARPGRAWPALCILAALLVVQPAPAGVVGDGTPASCTQSALQSALPAGGLITFNCGGAVTIPAAVRTFVSRENPPTIVDGGGLVTLDGTGGNGGILWIDGSPTAIPDITFKNIIFTKGAHTTGLISGGAIQNSGRLTLENAGFVDNAAPFGGAISQQACSGCLEPSTTITSSTFSGNKATNSGGAIVVGGGTLTATNCTFRQNSAVSGGATYFYLNSGQARTLVSISGLVFEGNSASIGSGGISISSLGATGGVSIVNSTFHGNTTSGTSGSHAGAIQGGGATTLISGVTITGNTAPPGGPAVRLSNGTTVRGTIIAGNSPVNCVVSGTLGTGSRFNLQSGDSTCPGFASGDPLLGPLGGNGGGTNTRVPATGSPAIDAIPASGCTETSDQRGLPRPSGTGCDIGAVEVDQGPPRFFVPALLSAEGLNASFFTSELTLTNRGTKSASLSFLYTSFLGEGSGTLENALTLSPGKQTVISDAIAFLREKGLSIPAGGQLGGTLIITFAGLSSWADAGVMARTATPVPPASPTGRAGLAYPGIPASRLLTGSTYICGMRDSSSDRSNVAVQNAGQEGDITLSIGVFLGDSPSGTPVSTTEVTLSPGGFKQFSLTSLSPQTASHDAYVKVERISGTAAYSAYGVINDNPTSDGSFAAPVAFGPAITGFTLPVVVETSTYETEVIVTNTASEPRTLRLTLSADSIADGSAMVPLTVPAYGQRVIGSFVEFIRQNSPAGTVPAGTSYVVPLSITPEPGASLSGVSVSARVSNPAVGPGRYGLFYTAVPYGSASSTTTWLSGLQQNETNRSNLALVNTGEAGDGSIDLEVALFDGATGDLTATQVYTVPARRIVQLVKVLPLLAPGTAQGYARVRRVSGTNPFIVYGVVNDGAEPGQRSGDGAFLVSQD